MTRFFMFSFFFFSLLVFISTWKVMFWTVCWTKEAIWRWHLLWDDHFWSGVWWQCCPFILHFVGPTFNQILWRAQFCFKCSPTLLWRNYIGTIIRKSHYHCSRDSALVAQKHLCSFRHSSGIIIWQEQTQWKCSLRYKHTLRHQNSSGY